MMSSKTKERLVDAGFPGIERRFPEHIMGLDKDLDRFVKSKYFKNVPTFSELIEACGGRFRNIRETPFRGEKEWKYAVNWSNHYMEGETNGAFPEEAVALLWLKINEK